MVFTDSKGQLWTTLTPTTQTNAEVSANAYVRQNPWKTDKYPLGKILQYAKAIHIPFAHTQRDVEFYQASPSIFKKFIMNAKAELMMDVPTGSRVVVLGKQEAYLVKLTSDVKAGMMPHVYLRRDLRNGGVRYYDGEENREWIASIQSFYVCHPDLSGQFKQPYGPMTILDPFFTLYRDVEVIADIHCDDWRVLNSGNKLPASGQQMFYFEPYDDGAVPNA
jgi:hypothetical protein